MRIMIGISCTNYSWKFQKTQRTNYGTTCADAEIVKVCVKSKTTCVFENEWDKIKLMTWVVNKKLIKIQTKLQW